MAEQRVRTALLDDPMMLAVMQLTWWRDAYSGILPENVLQMDEWALAEQWTALLSGTQQSLGARGLIAEERTHPVGFALVDPREITDGVGRIEVLGVVPRWARRGHGGRLLVECARILHDAGAETGAMWAIESDESFAQFLAGAGWGPSGKRRVLDTGSGQLTEIEYSGTLHLHLDDEP